MKACLVNFLRNYEATTSLKFEELEYEVTLTMKIVQRLHDQCEEENKVKEFVLICSRVVSIRFCIGLSLHSVKRQVFAETTNKQTVAFLCVY
jgi:hypothetical protein